MGGALVTELISRGYPVAAASRSRERLEHVFGSETENFLPLELDVTDEADVKKALKEVLAKFGRMDVLVNNGGYTSGDGGGDERCGRGGSVCCQRLWIAEHDMECASSHAPAAVRSRIQRQ
ncbi:MAG: SDR family NAD(P)-dependent oxidoreductase [Clostridia bacterium]|nr:SDR family NAD(P)-dependent oxidoreductase [Clostridia bacterium]